MMRTVRITSLAVLCLLSTSVLARQVAAPAATGTLSETKVAASALKGNLLGDPEAVRVAVDVPPSYATSPERRYPTHESRIRQRIETRVLRFFSDVLAFPAS